jgi:Rrf2 family protein
MKISRKSIYGARALIEIAIRTEDGGASWQQISSVAKTTAIPEKFLEQILLTLKKNGLLKSRRGVDGGYALNRPAAEITFDEMVQILDGRMLPEEEINEGPDGSGLMFRNLITAAEDAALGVLRGATVADLAKETRAWRQQQNPGMEFMI